MSPIRITLIGYTTPFVNKQKMDGSIVEQSQRHAIARGFEGDGRPVDTLLKEQSTCRIQLVIKSTPYRPCSPLPTIKRRVKWFCRPCADYILSAAARWVIWVGGAPTSWNQRRKREQNAGGMAFGGASFHIVAINCLIKCPYLLL